MREFKFRYWNPNKKEMVHPGGLCIVWTGECKRDHVIMQSTGLKDKNGKEIFEGDVLQGTYSHNLIVEHGEFGWNVKFEDLGSKYSEPMDDDLFKNYNLIIIGNIYENPELLESK
jgi:uncharacterized phage protein (TIGR01671 family)